MDENLKLWQLQNKDMKTYLQIVSALSGNDEIFFHLGPKMLSLGCWYGIKNEEGATLEQRKRRMQHLLSQSGANNTSLRELHDLLLHVDQNLAHLVLNPYSISAQSNQLKEIHSEKLDPKKELSSPIDIITYELDQKNRVPMASDLFDGKDPELDNEIQNLLYQLNRQDRWRTFAFKKGLASGMIEKVLSEAKTTGKPAYIVIPAVAKAKDYQRSEFLTDLKNLGVREVNSAVEEIEAHLAAKEGRKIKADKIQHDMNSFLRSWIEDNSLCDSPEDTQNRIDDLLRYKVTTKERLKKMTRAGFEKCGFEGMDADMAVDALQNI